MAWLHATPERKGEKAVSVPRMQTFQSKENLGLPQPLLDLPEVDAGQHLVDYLLQLGPTIGGEPLTYQEIAAWCGLTGIVLSSWEAVTLRALSASYASEYFAAKDPARPVPASEAA